MSDTYTATLQGADGSEEVELELISGEPQKSFTREQTIDGQPTSVLWELDADAPGAVYRPGGFPEHDYA
jgi:hypothetical protein